MSEEPKQPNLFQRRVLKPLPTAGASRRIKRQPANGDNKPAGSSESNDAPNEDGTTTPKGSTSKLPTTDETLTPKVPTITLNEAPLPEVSEKVVHPVVDEAKDAELRKKFLEMRLAEPQRAVVPMLHIPKKASKPPKQVQRRMARVKPTVKTAPRPEITFGTTVTVFGAETNDQKETVKGTRALTFGELNADSSSTVKEEEAPEKAEEEATPETSNALLRRVHRGKRDRPKARLPPPPPPDPSEALTEGKRKPISLEKSAAETLDDEARKKAETKAQFKKLVILLAQDIKEKKIPKSQLKMLTRGKSPEEAKVLMQVIEKAMRLAEKGKAKEQTAAPVEAAKPSKKEGDKGESKSAVDVPKRDPEDQTDTTLTAKGKERAAGGSIVDNKAATPST